VASREFGLMSSEELEKDDIELDIPKCGAKSASDRHAAANSPAERP
jgi:hypothetical protein